MAQSQQQYPPRPYASPHTTPSPIPGSAPAFTAPPIKRPQNSPTSPASPYPSLHSPPISGNGVSSFQSNPYHSQGSNPYPLPSNHQMSTGGQPLVRQTPPPQQSQPQTPIQSNMQSLSSSQQAGQTVMGPPPNKPEDDKPMDLNDIQDVLTGAGVDLKAEEAALMYDGSRRQAQTSNGPPQGYFDPQRNTWQVNVPGGRDSFYGAGPFNQAASDISPQSLEEQLEAKERLMIRRRNERDQYHSNNPFLQNRIVLQKIDTAGKKSQTTVPMEGVFHPQKPITTKLIINGPDGQDRIATLTKEPLLSMSAPMVDILTLLSLACRERLRNVIEDSASLVRSRRLTSHGVVPPDFQDIAVGEGEARAATAEPMPLIGAGSPDARSRKRSHSQANDLPTPVSETDKDQKPEPVPTIAYPDLVVEALQKQAEAEIALERERLAKRQQRTTASLISGSDPNSRAGSMPGTPAPSTPGPIDAIAPEAKLTKKEQKRREEERVAASAVKDTKNAVSMALGGSKKYSWMTGGKGGGGGGAGGGGPSGLGKKKEAKVKAAAAAEPAVSVTPTGAPTPSGGTLRGGKVLGAFREDREDGKGIQMRDLVSALQDGFERKTLSKSYYKLR